MSSVAEDRVTIQVAAQYGCRPLMERLEKCLQSGEECKHERRLLANCKVLVDDAPGAYKPSKQKVSGDVENPSAYVAAGNCSGPLARVKECLAKKHNDRRYCFQQIEDYKNCKMMLATLESRRDQQ